MEYIYIGKYRRRKANNDNESEPTFSSVEYFGFFHEKKRRKKLYICVCRNKIKKKTQNKKGKIRRRTKKKEKHDRGKKNPQQHPGYNQIDFQSGVVCVRDKLCSVWMQIII